ncbi:hypothetical protein GCM10011348_01190 [Marinobacterium nitratireducens]|uniref:DUF2069 domain-containing protein n=1 Tax=Marinobacterium nitratireducens TaxID=518897 RepID=A0A917Z5G3_9GAMM|nr:DUF2069 domain-containing protein [Marinobacterium nitratireducens]GGO75722.1 hypothetical protein GCM10011348_01190 [Marinobacterium nitratireducens]
MTTDIRKLQSRVRLARLLTLASFGALLALLTLWFMVLRPAPGDHPWVVWLWHLLPLLAFAPSIIRGRPRAHAWLCFFLLILFIEAILAATNPATFGLGLAYSLLVGVLFVAAMYYARWKGQLLRSENAG